MRTISATLAVASLLTVLLASAAAGSPTEVQVRVEGRGKTLFEGPILTEGHNVRASSDAGAPAAGRRCNGLNNGQNALPGPTPTAAAVDAMALIGEDFDGRWYASPFEDYFIKRWGPDAQDEAASEFWGLAVNNVFTSVGGCQYQLDGGDEVLWIYDAFRNRPRLVLYPAGYAGGAVQLTTTVAQGEPLELEVDSWSGYNEGSPPPAPTRSTSTFADATVAPVATDAQGFELVEVGSADAALTGADGTATVSFEQTGWHRLKATAVDSQGKETVVRSNRLDVCVLPDPSCATPPAEDLARTPPPPQIGGDEGGAGGGQPGAAKDQSQTAPGAAADPAPLRLSRPRLDRSRISRGLLGVSWRVHDPGAGVAVWSISSRTLGRPGTRYVERARGSIRSATTLRLPPGCAYRLRLTVTDRLGRAAGVAIARVWVPR
jgi:hypothetical protein